MRRLSQGQNDAQLLTMVKIKSDAMENNRNLEW